MKNLLLSVAVCLLASWQFAFGLEVIKVTVDVNDGQYSVVGQSKIDVPPEFVFNTLLDYENFHKLATGISETKFLPPDEPDSILAYTRFESCVLFFCKTIEKVERIKSSPYDLIQVQAIPERSDFIFSETRWIIQPTDGGTTLTFEAEFEPEFWIPPLIGPWAIRRKLTQTAEVIGMRIEWIYERGLTLAQVSE